MTRFTKPSRRAVGVGVLVIVVGALVGLIVGLARPAQVDIAGSQTQVALRFGQTYDEFGVRGLVVLKRSTDRALIGEPIGIRATLDLDASQLVTSDGGFNTDVLPAYIQAYSDPQQLVDVIRSALLRHLIWYTAGGAVIASVLLGAVAAHRRWRRRYDAIHWPNPSVRRDVRAYRRPERVVATRVAVAVVVLIVVGLVPSGRWSPPPKATLQADEIFDGTPLAGAEVDGLLKPALSAVQSYVRKYFGQTDAYYDALRTKLDAQLAADPVSLPSGDDIVQLGFVTDRHCNTGMDRVTVELMKHFGVRTLVSSGDDAFSGTFAFESACTSGLAARTKAAGITAVAVGGNHDSPLTLADERKQGITVLDGKVVTVDGVRFLGSPDPRTSRYGQGIVPSSDAAQAAVLKTQADALAATACKAPGPIVTVAHDPKVGVATLQQGCGHVTLALNGHTHEQAGPTAYPLTDAVLGYQFTGGSAGGAPNENSVDRSFASSLTVGPLNHDAFVYVLSVNRRTGSLAGVTEFRFTPEQQITVTPLVVPTAT